MTNNEKILSLLDYIKRNNYCAVFDKKKVDSFYDKIKQVPIKRQNFKCSACGSIRLDAEACCRQ